MKILFLSTWFPYPPNQGSKIRAYYLLRALASAHEVTLVSYEDADLEPAWRTHIEGLCHQVITLPRQPFSAGRLKTLLGLFSPLPSAVVGMHSPEMATLVKTTAQEWQPDVVVALTFVTAPYAAQLQALKVLDIDNYMARMLHDLVALASSGRERLRRWLAYRKFLGYERSLYAQFDLCLAVTEDDRRLVIDELGLQPERVTVTPNGVDTAYNHPGLGFPEPGTLIYSGAITYSANYDAVEYFVQQIYPLVLKEAPATRLRVTGRTDSIDLAALTYTGCVEFTGYVDDIRPVIAGGSVCIVPLRLGGGTRRKILEAMALGAAVVSTSTGAEGLDGVHGEHLMIADTPETFAAATIELLRSPELRSRLGRNAVQRVRELYDWENIGSAFLQAVEAKHQARIASAVRIGNGARIVHGN